MQITWMEISYFHIFLVKRKYLYKQSSKHQEFLTFQLHFYFPRISSMLFIVHIRNTSNVYFIISKQFMLSRRFIGTNWCFFLDNLRKIARIGETVLLWKNNYSICISILQVNVDVIFYWCENGLHLLKVIYFSCVVNCLKENLLNIIFHWFNWFLLLFHIYFFLKFDIFWKKKYNKYYTNYVMFCVWSSLLINYCFFLYFSEMFLKIINLFLITIYCQFKF